MGILEIITLVLTIVVKFVLPAIGGTAVAATVIPNRAKSGNPFAQGFLDLVNFGGANFGAASNRD